MPNLINCSENGWTVESVTEGSLHKKKKKKKYCEERHEPDKEKKHKYQMDKLVSEEIFASMENSVVEEGYTDSVKKKHKTKMHIDNNTEEELESVGHLEKKKKRKYEEKGNNPTQEDQYENQSNGVRNDVRTNFSQFKKSKKKHKDQTNKLISVTEDSFVEEGDSEAVKKKHKKQLKTNKNRDEELVSEGHLQKKKHKEKNNDQFQEHKEQIIDKIISKKISALTDDDFVENIDTDTIKKKKKKRHKEEHDERGNNVETESCQFKEPEKKKKRKEWTCEKISASGSFVVSRDIEILNKKKRHKDKTKRGKVVVDDNATSTENLLSILEDTSDEVNISSVNMEKFKAIENLLSTLHGETNNNDSHKEHISNNTISEYESPSFNDETNTNTSIIKQNGKEVMELSEEQHDLETNRNEALLKKRKKHKDNRKRLLAEDSFRSTDNSIDGVITSINTTPLKKLRKEKHSTDSHESMKESVTVVKSEFISPNNSFTIEVEEDRHGSLDNSFSSCVKESEPNNTKSVSNEQISCKKNKSKSPESKQSETEENKDVDSDSLEDFDKKLALLKNEDDTELMDEKVLYSLLITLPWPVPPLHEIETRFSSVPTVEQKKKISNLGVKLKSGIFTMVEDDQIKRNWKEFCKRHDIDVYETNPSRFMNVVRRPKFPSDERIKFARFLAHGLDNRLLHTVYKRFDRLIAQETITTGRFSRQEDKIILDYVNNNKSRTQYADLAKILKRDKLAIEKRHKVLCNQQETNQKWDHKEDIERFVKHLLEVTGCSDVEELENKTVTTEQWKKLGKKLNIAADKLRRAWLNTIHPHIFIEHTQLSRVIKKQLIEILIQRNEHDWRSVNWNDIAKNFKGFTALSLSRFFKNTVAAHVPESDQHDLRECLAVLEDVAKNGRFSRVIMKKIEITTKNGSVPK